MATITINPNGDLVIDGVNKGHFLDFHHVDAQPRPESMLATDPARACLHAELKAAFDVWHVTQRSMVTDLQRAHAATVEALNKQIADLSQYSPAHQADIKKKAIDEALARIADAQKTIAGLSAP